MRSTNYADLIAEADDGGHRIERLRIREKGEIEIRFSWWKNGKFTPRPLDLTEGDLLVLIDKAISAGVFTEDFLRDLHAMLYAMKPQGPVPGKKP